MRKYQSRLSKFRSIDAAASLKHPLPVPVELRANLKFRSIDAAASLKLQVCVCQVGAGQEIPQHRCCGLIEAANRR